VKVEVDLKHCHEESAELYFSVTDTGIGIAKENQEAIFSSFTQAETHISRQYGGSGLGLSIVKSLVTNFNGTIEVDSELDKGSCFTVTIPVKLVHNGVADLAEIDDSSEVLGRDIQVLLVEDNKTNAYVMQALGIKLGMQFNWVTDGQQAIDDIKLHSYDLIIMDNQMPILDGIEATRQIRQDLKLSTPIIACTADGYENTARAFMDAGANAVLVKPIIEHQLIQTVQRVIKAK
jgi:two-component system autoinducer 2 sensor kinase/phosphatase LuxQ